VTERGGGALIEDDLLVTEFGREVLPAPERLGST